MTFPKKYGPTEVPPSVETLIAVLLPQLLEGPHPALAALREQSPPLGGVPSDPTREVFFFDLAIGESENLVHNLGIARVSLDIDAKRVDCCGGTRANGWRRTWIRRMPSSQG